MIKDKDRMEVYFTITALILMFVGALLGYGMANQKYNFEQNQTINYNLTQQNELLQYGYNTALVQLNNKMVDEFEMRGDYMGKVYAYNQSYNIRCEVMK